MEKKIINGWNWSMESLQHGLSQSLKQRSHRTYVNQEKQTCVYVIFLGNGKKIVGKAKCSPDDIFSIPFGLELAEQRANIKYYDYKRSVISNAFKAFDNWTSLVADNCLQKIRKSQEQIDEMMLNG